MMDRQLSSEKHRDEMSENEQCRKYGMLKRSKEIV